MDVILNRLYVKVGVKKTKKIINSKINNIHFQMIIIKDFVNVILLIIAEAWVIMQIKVMYMVIFTYIQIKLNLFVKINFYSLY